MLASLGTYSLLLGTGQLDRRVQVVLVTLTAAALDLEVKI